MSSNAFCYQGVAEQRVVFLIGARMADGGNNLSVKVLRFDVVATVYLDSGNVARGRNGYDGAVRIIRRCQMAYSTQLRL